MGGMADYIFTQHGNNNVQIGDAAGMKYSVDTALKWALNQNFQSVAAQYARTLGYEVDRQAKEIVMLRDDLAQARAEDALLQSENETLWGEIGYTDSDQVDAARFFHKQKADLAALREENERLRARWTETASDNTDYTLSHLDGIYTISDPDGSVVCEFIHDAALEGGPR